MALGTFSKFYYGYEIDLENYKIDFDEGSGELTAELTVGTYSPAGLATEIKTQLDAVGTKTYTVTFNRSSRFFTIACDSGTFDILIDTGTNKSLSPYDLLGFTGSVDLTGAGSYSSDSASGYEYKPQFWLQDYTSPDDWIELIDPSVNISANNIVEVVSFGDVSFTEFTIQFITDLPMDGRVILNNPNGVFDANHFMQYAIRKGKLDFMPDVNNLNTYWTLILESTPDNRSGVGYRLREETSRNLPNIYQTGRLKFRVVE